MTPRPRKKGNRDLPPNLERNTSKGRIYYRYRDPRTGKYHSLGRDKEAAVRDAIALNNAIYAAIRQRITDQIIQPPTPLLRDYADHYLDLCRERGQAANTIRGKRSHLHRLTEALGHIPIGEITVRQIADLLGTYHDQGKARTAQALRSTAIDLFKDAIHEGLLTTNPAAATRPPVVKVQRARLTLDQFRACLAAAEQHDPWMGNALLLALLTGQRREDLVRLRFRDARDGYLHVVQAKTGTRLKIDTRLRLDAIGLSIEDAITRCRDRVVSPWLLHHTIKRTRKSPGNPVHKDTLSRAFARLRQEAGIEPEDGKQPPTFHEIRSLAARLWAEQEGKEFAQALLGHKDARMTAVYRDSRGAEWQEVSSTHP